MTYRDRLGGANSTGEIAGPIGTNFTANQPDVPAGQQHSSAPTASQLGLVPPVKATPQRGWRKLVHRATGGSVNPGVSAAEASAQALADRVNQPVRGSYSIAVLSIKGGVGKTTTTVGLGTTFASLRGDRVIAVDANPDFGTLAQRGPNQTRSTVRDLLSDGDILRYSDIRRHTSQSSSRLEFLSSERDPEVSEAFSERDYRAVHKILDRFYNIILADCGTGLTHSAMQGVLETTDALVVVASPAVDSARSALATLDWLLHHGYSGLVPDATVVLSSPRPGDMPINLDQLTHHFRSRVRSVFTISYDRHLAEGGEVALELMNPLTRRQYMNLAASMADAFGRPNRTKA
ncbi:MinD/ParA family protein [Mycobacterium sp. AZCC_0083]|uniref:MinD/ParA family ATP-binding protein n=1 Tax=Mycobacterium sp. AZCC_0083 TaxID=2735882 RepID=UPI00161EF88F|nr:MinD/ParA family protein [Mycobacterium sp. AZCC_0083]MBB5167562.1 MinD-like ATPase involved in chromosome partitioning or flagellar assembly [Mycobacterium sp. AZCC_0083]